MLRISAVDDRVRDICLAPQQYTGRPIRADDFLFSACNGTELPSEDCVEIPVVFHKPAVRALAALTLNLRHDSRLWIQRRLRRVHIRSIETARANWVPVRIPDIATK